MDWCWEKIFIFQTTDLMCDRHIDQLLMCAVYIIGKVTEEPLNFQDIMKCYRFQPQAQSHVSRFLSKRFSNSSNTCTYFYYNKTSKFLFSTFFFRLKKEYENMVWGEMNKIRFKWSFVKKIYSFSNFFARIL